MGSGNSSELQKSYHCLPLLVDQFQNDSEATNSKQNNEYFSIDEQKSKLLSTVTFNEYNTYDTNPPILNTKDILNNSGVLRSGLSLNNEDTIEDQSDNSFKMHIESQDTHHIPFQCIDKSPLIEENEHYKFSQLSKIKLNHQNDNIHFRNYRINSFNSVQGLGEQLSEIGQDHLYLKYPRNEPVTASDSGQVMLQKKLSATTNLECSNTSSNYDIENQNAGQALNHTHNNIDLNDLHKYFVTPTRLVRVTSLEVKLPKANMNRSEIIGLDDDDKQERDKILRLRKKFLEQKK